MNLKSISFFMLTLVLFAACKKDDFYSGTYEKKISIKLNNDYVSAQKIDSAVLISSWPGLTKRARLKLKDGNLEITLSEFSQTAHKVTVQLFTKALFKTRPLQFERDIALAQASPQRVEVNAPASFTDLSWKPRVILDHQGITTRYTAIVALRTSDPYFEILNLPAGWTNRTTVFRGFFKDDYTNLVTATTWNCGNYCSGNIVERDAFKNLAAQVDHLDWNKAGIEVAFYTSPTTIDELVFTYDK